VNVCINITHNGLFLGENKLIGHVMPKAKEIINIFVPWKNKENIIF